MTLDKVKCNNCGTIQLVEMDSEQCLNCKKTGTLQDMKQECTEGEPRIIVKNMTTKQIKSRLEHIRKQIKAECVSYGELVELRNLSKHIDKGDILLLEWAGVEEQQEVFHCSNCQHEMEEAGNELICENCGAREKI